MAREHLEVQLDWDVSELRARWGHRPDDEYLMRQLLDAPVEATAAGATGRILEVAAAEAIHSCRLSLRGLETFALDPSPAMLERARDRIAQYRAAVTLVRGIGETLPFHDHTFDRVLCDSAIDHFADPERGIREMARVLKPDGRLVLSIVNYGGATVRASRLVYGAARRLGRVPAEARFFWDSPVPLEHTFECTYRLLLGLCRRHLDLERVFGVSVGWMAPGWGAVLRRLSPIAAVHILRALDRLAHRWPAMADYVVSVWRPPAERGRGLALTATVPEGGRQVTRDDPVYASRARSEAAYWGGRTFSTMLGAALHADDRFANRFLTGSADRSWLEDVAGRGPYHRAAALGCELRGHEMAWLRTGASHRFDVYELSAGVIRTVRADLARWRGPRRGVARFIRTDLNFVRLPAGRYDVIWSSGCLHHLFNLEHLFAEIERALTDEGLFALHDYVGEPRLRWAPARLERINAALRDVPVQFRRGGAAAVTAPRPGELSPFCAVRSDEILPLARARFEVVHLAFSGALFPLPVYLDLPALEQEAPEILAAVLRAEEEALSDPTVAPCAAYAVFRKRRSRGAPVCGG